MARAKGIAFEEAALAEFVAEAGFRDIPAPVRARAARVFQDTVGGILRGAAGPGVRRRAAAVPKADRGPACPAAGGCPGPARPGPGGTRATGGIGLELDE